MAAWNLKGKRVLITGGSRGIGAATVAEFASLGAEVLFVARGSVADERAMLADITQAEDRARIVSRISAQWGALDVLVNNAGMNIRKPWVEMNDQEQAMVMGTNLLGPAALLRGLHPFLCSGHLPSVVNVTSVAGAVDVASGAAYAMSKAALEQLTRSLAVEWAKDGIRVNAVAPWYIRTPLTEPVLSQAERYTKIIERTPLGRVGTAEEVAASIAFLAMDKSSFITGQCLVADGGFLASGM